MRFQAKPFGHATTSPKWRMFLFPINQDQFVDFWSEMSQQGKVWHQDDCQKLEPGCSGKAPWIRLSHIFCWWISGMRDTPQIPVGLFKGDFFGGISTMANSLLIKSLIWGTYDTFSQLSHTKLSKSRCLLRGFRRIPIPRSFFLKFYNP